MEPTQAEPHARQVYVEMLSPHSFGRRAMEGRSEWSEGLVDLPQQSRRIVERMERGSVQVAVRDEGRAGQTERSDRMASRLAASILIAAFIVAVSLLVPLLSSDPWRLLAAAQITTKYDWRVIGFELVVGDAPGWRVWKYTFWQNVFS
ncbi:MAG: hypothetical protein M1482_07265 [Chloroflexi bacterium]|nr:hypothetical protein [Chloroflexota bacterium]